MEGETVSAAQFVEAMFQGMAPGTHTMLTAFAGDPYEKRDGMWAGRPWWPGLPIPTWYPGAGVLDLSRSNTYLTVSTFDPDPTDGRRRRRKAQFRRMHAVMVDDVGDGLGSKVARDKLALSPTALIETSPGNLQAYYFLRADDASGDRAQCERVVERMIAAGLTTDSRDPGMRGVTRYGRMPLGVNGKRKYPQPCYVRCVHWSPDRRYSIADIAKAWSLDLSQGSPATLCEQITPESTRDSERRFTLLLRCFRALGMYQGEATSGWHNIVCPWIHEHTDRDASGTALAAPGPDNHWQGGFRCHHGHGDLLDMHSVLAFVRELDRGWRRRRRGT